MQQNVFDAAFQGSVGWQRPPGLVNPQACLLPFAIEHAKKPTQAIVNPRTHLQLAIQTTQV